MAVTLAVEVVIDGVPARETVGAVALVTKLMRVGDDAVPSASVA